VTAGHCVDGQPDGVVDQGFLDTVVEFNVPPSLPNGASQPALPEDQFPVTGIYVAWQFIGIGADWAVFHAGPNANGVTPQQAQGGFFRVSGAAESTIGQTMRVTGYGWDWTPGGHRRQPLPGWLERRRVVRRRRSMSRRQLRRAILLRRQPEHGL
jgi:hypothetical protein